MEKGFTLAEMLAVIGIMLVLMVAAFGVFNSLALRAGPETAVSTVQAMLNAARDYAATNGVVACIEFKVDPQTPLDGSIMTMKYRPAAGGALASWTAVRGRKSVAVAPGEPIFVCKDMPPGMPAPPSVAADTKGVTVTPAERALWKKFEKDTSDAITTWAWTAPTLNSNHNPIYVVFDPAGYLKTDVSGDDNNTRVVQYAVTIVQVAGNRVVGSAFYPMNPNAGTRLLFTFE